MELPFVVKPLSCVAGERNIVKCGDKYQGLVLLAQPDPIPARLLVLVGGPATWRIHVALLQMEDYEMTGPDTTTKRAVMTSAPSIAKNLHLSKQR